MWNSVEYFETKTRQLKLTKDKYAPVKISGMKNLEGIMSDRTGSSAYVAVDDTDDGMTFKGAAGGFFKRRTVIIFILQKYRITDLTDRQTKLDECRQIMNRFQSAVLKDAEEKEIEAMQYVDTTRMPHYEIDEYFANGCTGLYFMITLNEPTDLTYAESDWES